MTKAPLLQIGADPKSIKAVSDAVLAVLRVPSIDNKTKIAAIKAIEAAARVEGTQINNCNFQG